MRALRPYAAAMCRANARGHMRTRWLLGGLGSALGIALVAISLSQDTHAVGPDRPFKAYAPFVASDEGSSAPVATPTARPTSAPPSTPVPTPGAGAETNLQPQLDTAHAVSKLVTYAAGGTLTTTGADGSKYTLILPPHSVLFDVTVTMTPIKALGGLAASGGLRAGVQLEPDGMWLGVPAILDIVAANPVSFSEEISFAYGGSGQQAYGYGLDMDASRTRFTILHFSGWAIAGGDDTQRLAFFQSKVNSVSNQLSQDFAAAVAAERARPGFGDPGDSGSAEFVAAMERALTDGYTNLVKPAMDTAEALADKGDIDSVEPGLQAYLTWERQMQLLGFEGLEAARAALKDQWFRILDKVVKNMRDRCVDKHDLSMVPRLVGMARQFALLGGDDERALDFAKKCATFKLDFETTITIGDAGTTAWAYHVRTLGVPVILFLDVGLPVVKALELLSFDSDPLPSCSFDGSGVHPTDPFEVNSGRLVATPRAGKLEITDVELVIRMGDLGGSYVWHCPDGDVGYISIPDGGLGGFFHLFHISEFVAEGILVSDWDMLGGSDYARKTYSQTIEGGTEQTTLILKHTPK